MMKSELLDIIKEVEEAYGDDYEFIGIRTQHPIFSYGPMDHISSVWIDGEETEEILDGVCCTDINDDEIESHCEDSRFSRYLGEHTAIIAGNFAYGGDDIGELIISDPVVIRIIR